MPVKLAHPGVQNKTLAGGLKQERKKTYAEKTRTRYRYSQNHNLAECEKKKKLILFWRKRSSGRTVSRGAHTIYYDDRLIPYTTTIETSEPPGGGNVHAPNPLLYVYRIRVIRSIFVMTHLEHYVPPRTNVTSNAAFLDDRRFRKKYSILRTEHSFTFFAAHINPSPKSRI